MSLRDLITFGLGPAVAVAPTAAQIADAVWDEARAGHVGAGSFGAVTEWAAATDTAAIADAVWDELSTGHTGAGKAGAQLWTDVDAILEDTGTTLDTLINGIPAAVWTYTTRTLTSLSALVASIAAAVWAYATRTLTSTAAATTAAVTGSALTITRAATYSATLSGLTISASWTKMYFTVKRSKTDADSASVLQVVVSNPAVGATDGALYVDGSAASSAQRTRAALTVDQAGGTVKIDIEDDLAADLPEVAGLYYDIKEMLSGTSKSYIKTASTVTIENPVTLTV